MKLTIKNISVLLLFFSLLSCKKYLDKKSNDVLVVPTTILDLQGLLDDESFMNFTSPTAFGEASSDNIYLPDATYNSVPANQLLYVWGDYIYSTQDWSQGYIPIYNVNLCLERLQNIPQTNVNQLQWNNIKGSSLFYRAYYFSQLAWEFSKAYDESSANTDLGIPLRTTSDFHDPSIRASVKETYAKILDDGTASIQYLPDNPIHSLRPSKCAAYGLLSRLYLSMRKYDSAFKYSNLCLGLTRDTLLDYNTIVASSGTPFTGITFGHETIFFTQMARTIDLTNPNNGMVDTSLYISYDNNDIRKTAFFEVNGTNHAFKGTYGTDSKFNLFTGIATDEMYLTRAECYARQGNATLALNDLNAVIKKRWKNTVPYPSITAIDANDALAKVLIERRKELVMRGLRWMDIKRLNKGGANITLKRIIAGQSFTLLPNDNRYALPLPLDIIQLTGMPQNPR